MVVAVASCALLALAPLGPAGSAGVRTSQADVAGGGDGATDDDTPHPADETPVFTSDHGPSPTPGLDVDAPPEAVTGSSVVVTVKVTGVAVDDELVLVESPDGDAWTAVASEPVTNGSAHVTFTAGPIGATAYRARLAGTTDHDEAIASFTIQVVASPDPTPDPPPPPKPPECGGQAPRKPDGSSWVCTYDDEFDGDALDRRYWVPQVSAGSGFFTGTSAQPACFRNDPGTIAVRDGKLALSARVLDEPVACGGVTTRLVSGMVTHHGTFEQAYGRYEVRARVPSYAGDGLQETFWLWPVDVLRYGTAHPMSGEIDFAEFYSDHSTLTIPVIHYVFDPWTFNIQTSTNVYTSWICGIRPGEFNTYTLEWLPGTITIAVNGTTCLTDHYTATNAPEGHPYAPFDVPFFLALTQAFGTTDNAFDVATGPTESTTEVDYVRVWS